jgi:hypothetical protein
LLTPIKPEATLEFWVLKSLRKSALTHLRIGSSHTGTKHGILVVGDRSCDIDGRRAAKLQEHVDEGYQQTRGLGVVVGREGGGGGGEGWWGGVAERGVVAGREKGFS